jgi:hypothetical protein
MRIAIDVNGVLRDTLLRIEQVYTKFYVDNPFITDEEKEPYEVLSPVETLDISKHLKFKDEDEVYDFLYREHTMEIFGHAPSVEMTSFNDFNEFILTTEIITKLLLYLMRLVNQNPQHYSSYLSLDV